MVGNNSIRKSNYLRLEKTPVQKVPKIELMKLDKRLKAVTEEERDGDLFSALHASLVSSDESDTEDNSLRTRPLSWRTENVNNFSKLLDGRAKAAMTSQQRRQSVSRRQGVASERGTDTVPGHLKWAVCNSP
ncbi:unnamed protein product [Porites lobata]|uniref:Uncharacterized protein n=1 Tax=Porites lobata TaxID=104759 RepID=A0ABN8RTW6_9CNID|nr:unnamed protein product [Porites lobata]